MNEEMILRAKLVLDTKAFDRQIKQLQKKLGKAAEVPVKLNYQKQVAAFRKAMAQVSTQINAKTNITKSLKLDTSNLDKSLGKFKSDLTGLLSGLSGFATGQGGLSFMEGLMTGGLGFSGFGDKLKKWVATYKGNVIRSVEEAGVAPSGLIKLIKYWRSAVKAVRLYKRELKDARRVASSFRGGFGSSISIKPIQDAKIGLEAAKTAASAYSSSLLSLAGAYAAVAAAAIAAGAILAKQAQDYINAARGFRRIAVDIQTLREATGGAMSDTQLMQMANMADRLGVNVKNLGVYFEYASKVAAETGQNVDYLVQSIVTGIGRESKLIIDNLGISQKELNEEIKKTGDFEQAVVNIIKRNAGDMKYGVEDTIASVDKWKVVWEELVDTIGDLFIVQALDVISSAIADIVLGVIRLVRFVNKLVLALLNLTKISWVLDKIVKGIAWMWDWLVKVAGQLDDIVEGWAGIGKATDAAKGKAEDYGDAVNEALDKVKGGLINAIQNSIKSINEQLAAMDDPFSEEANQLKKAREELEKLLQNATDYREVAGDIAKLKPFGAIPTSGLVSEMDIYSPKGPEIPGILESLESQRAMWEKKANEATNMADTRYFLKMMKGVENQIAKVRGETDLLTNSFVDFGMVLADLVSSMLQSFGNMLGNLVEELATFDKSTTTFGKVVLKAFGDFLKNLGKMAITYGSLLIAQGVAQKVFLQGGPMQKIAAGAALVGIGMAAAGAGAAMSKAGGANVTSTASQVASSANCTLNQLYDYDRNVEFRLRGEDLVASVGRTTARVGGSVLIGG